MNLTGLMSKPEKDTSKKTFIRTCKLCGRDFIAPTNNTMRCPECRKVMRQQQSAASYKRFLTKMEMRKMREKTTQGGVTAEKKKDGVPISYWSAALNMLQCLLMTEHKQRYAIRDIARIAVVWNRPAMHRQCF